MSLYRLDVHWIGGTGLDLFAQVLDVGAYKLGAARISRVIPHILQELLAVEYLIGIAHQMIEQIELDVCQQDGLMRRRDFERAAVKDDVADNHLVDCIILDLFGANAPQDSFDAQLKLLHVERLDEIIVAPGAEAFDLVLIFRFGGQEKDGYILEQWIAANLPANLIPVDAGHHNIQDEQIRPMTSSQLQAFDAAIGGHHLIVIHLQCAL